MADWDVPGLALAVVKEGRLVLARGYGVADPLTGETVAPDSLFRIASVSKPVTAAAVLMLVENGRLALDDRVFVSLLPEYVRRCHSVDPRLQDMTVRDLLAHASGWDTSNGVDPMFNAARIAGRLDIPGLDRVEAVIQHQVCSPLKHAPGREHVYENLNYAVLGRVIEAVTRISYEDYVRAAVFARLGITAPRIGSARPSGRLPGEVAYVAQGDDRHLVTSVFGESEPVPLQYGGFDLRAMDSHGGWVASAPDLARFLAGLDGLGGVPDLLAPATRVEMGANPGPPLYSRRAGAWYGLGWYRNRRGTWFHDGSLPGSSAFVAMEPDGTLYAALANSRRPGPAYAEAFVDAVRAAATSNIRQADRDLFAPLGYLDAAVPASQERP